MTRKERLQQQTPRWADAHAIFAIYCEAAARREKGEAVVVDHIYPLAGTCVSGLHVAANLQIVQATDNARKGNTLLSIPAVTLQRSSQMELF